MDPEFHSHPGTSDDLNPKVSLAMVLLLPFNRVEDVRRLLHSIEDVQVVLAKVGPPRSLWVVEADREPARGERP